jgi:hypothetical protein
VSKILRQLLIFLAALPLVLGAVTAGFAAPPCPFGHADRTLCPCCDKMIVTAAVPCLQCQSAVESTTASWLPRLEAEDIAFALLSQRADGLSIQPPLPPPRSTGFA